jgi:hypothetical protein
MKLYYIEVSFKGTNFSALLFVFQYIHILRYHKCAVT